MRLPLLVSIALLGACNASEPDTVAPDEELASEATAPAPVPTAPAATQPPPAAVTANQIPPSLQGRWGLVAADCEPGRADAKGLLVISPTRLEFYESVGTLATITEGTDSRIRGSFGFTGEGMEWQRDVTLDVQDGGKTLIRREYGEDAAPGPFKYMKCA